MPLTAKQEPPYKQIMNKIRADQAERDFNKAMTQNFVDNAKRFSEYQSAANAPDPTDV